MKESRKISFIYSAITISLVVIAGIVFYFMMSHYTENLYFKYLEEKAHVIGTERFEKDEMTPDKYRNVVLHREKTIPTSKEEFINLADSMAANKLLIKYLSPAQITNLYQDKEVDFHYEDMVGTALIYYDNEGTFAIIVLSRNPYGHEITKCIGWAILLLVLASALILYLISRLYAIRIVERINKNYCTEKLFVNNASHEINNPLTAIQGECDIALMRQRTNEEYRNSLQRISQETERIIRIMSQLLQFSHTRTEKIEPITLDKIEIGSFMQQFADSRTKIEINDNFNIMAKEDLFRIAMRNLISNAHKYSGGKEINVVISTYRIEIHDNGIGISKTDIKNVFEPFYRGKNTNGTSGTGIGLTLAKEILEKYSCKLSVTSEINKGTTFIIDFNKSRKA